MNEIDRLIEKLSWSALAPWQRNRWLITEAANTLARFRDALEQARLAIEEAAYGGHVAALNNAHEIITDALTRKGEAS